MKQNVVLTGMSGAGKSTIGVLLAKTFGAGFIDTDIVIQQKAGRTLQDIIDSNGIGAFLRLEEETVCALEVYGSVIATGGSVVYSPSAMADLKKNGVIVYLKVPFPELERRLTNVVSRGIVMNPDSTLEEVFLQRKPLYEKYCDICIECAGLDIEGCVTRVAEELKPRLLETL